MSSSQNGQVKLTVDTFYEKQKELYDICGNVINKEKYPFVDILSKYLTDIVGLIDIEIKNSARNSMINWREKKNPKLLSRLINSDENVNLINMSMNKITSSNYMNIANEISQALLNDNYRKLPDYCSFLFDVVIKKCMIDEAFSKDYIRFLFGFKDAIAKHLSENINKFIDEAVLFLTSNQQLKEYSYFQYVKDVAQWRNVGVILSNIYKSVDGTIDNKLGVKQFNIVSNLESQFDILFNILDWLPANMDELNGRLFMVFAVMENLFDDIWNRFTEKYRTLFNEILTLVYNCANVPNKIKFKILDLQDMIKNYKPSAVVASANVVIEKSPISEGQGSNKKSEVSSVLPNTQSTSPITSPSVAPTTTTPITAAANSVNIWEARKQQTAVNAAAAAATTVQSNSTSNTNGIALPITTHTNITNVKDNNGNQRAGRYNKEDGSFRGRNRGRDMDGNANGNRYRRSSNGRGNGNANANVNANSNDIRKVEEEPKSRNMFSGLESGDSNDEHSNDTMNTKLNEEEDEFITVEKKTKNLYKPKKTPAIAVEGGKIYSNVSSKTGPTHNSKRN